MNAKGFIKGVETGFNLMKPILSQKVLATKIGDKLAQTNTTLEELFESTKPSDKTKKRLGRQTIRFANPPRIVGNMSIVGTKEGQGPLKDYFHKIIKDDKYGQKTFELAENSILHDAIQGALDDAGLDKENIDVVLAGDLLNQIIASSYAVRGFESPFLGQYGACSTMAQSLALGAILVDSGYAQNAVCATGSHFSTAERQYRGPLEYGCQRQPYAQWTVTGAGCSVLAEQGKGPKISHAVFGKIIDYGIKDIANMGAAMAPAAMDTFRAFFIESGLSIDDFDALFTGDLGKLGSDVFRSLMLEQGYDLGAKYADCGAMIYDVHQKAYQGGSGCGCSAAVLNSFILDKLKKGEYNRIFFAATGALMSLTSSQQGETIPAVCHGVVIER